jgi:hypothetical protein
MGASGIVANTFSIAEICFLLVHHVVLRFRDALTVLPT